MCRRSAGSRVPRSWGARRSSPSSRRTSPRGSVATRPPSRFVRWRTPWTRATAPPSRDPDGTRTSSRGRGPHRGPRPSAFRTMTDDVAELLDRVPGWHGRAHAVGALDGGITNRNLLVDVEGERFVLRLAGKDTEL